VLIFSIACYLRFCLFHFLHFDLTEKGRKPEIACDELFLKTRVDLSSSFPFFYPQSQFCQKQIIILQRYNKQADEVEVEEEEEEFMFKSKFRVKQSCLLRVMPTFG